MAESEMSQRIRLLIEIKIVFITLQKLLLVLRLRHGAQIARSDSREHRPAEHARHVRVQQLPRTLPHPQLRIFAQTEVLQHARLAAQHSAGAIVEIVAGRLRLTPGAQNSLRIDTSDRGGRIAPAERTRPAGGSL